ncbi:MAG: hypothetical protein G3M78_13600 [Candidatus Nitrohelix vancouverensis]|uniref:Uncharacterized protein n=1 Tax=Candidatus Nitrohelix vancouverensis TaxID=2705534 RepID=A0A7T0C4I3_9BACT|nr:MAG: hypothetical protein G3M78_13600 [Candidatus Nitrohelix vancouverensis]
MKHEKFVEKLRNGDIHIVIDRAVAFKIVETGRLGAAYQKTQTVYTWIWFLGLPLGIALALLYKWWLGLIVIFISLGLPQGIKRSASRGVRDKLIEDPEFFEFALQYKAFEIVKNRR